jgi:hypothetical protein
MDSYITSPSSSPVASPPAVGASFLAAVPSRQRCISSDAVAPDSKRTRRSDTTSAVANTALPESTTPRQQGAQIPTPAATPAFRSFHAYEDAASARQQVLTRPYISRTSSFPLATSRRIPPKVTVTTEAAADVVVDEAQTTEDVKIIEDTNRKPERRSGRRATESNVQFVPQVSTKESLVAGLVGECPSTVTLSRH